MYFLDNHFSLGQSDVFFLMLLVLFVVLNQCSFIITLPYNGKNKLLKKLLFLEYRFGCDLLLFNKGATKSTFFSFTLNLFIVRTVAVCSLSFFTNEKSHGCL